MTLQAGSKTSRWRRYPECRDSGVEWLGDIPAHWDVTPLKDAASIENSGAYGAEPGEADLDLPVCTTAHISSNGVFLVDEMPLRAFSSKEAEKYVGKLGDIFVVKSSGSNTNIISGKLAIVAEGTPQIVFSNFLMRIRTLRRVAIPQFISYFLASGLTRERIKRMVATTTYPNINVPEYVGSKIAVPPTAEQEEIAEFLDPETAKIDARVAKKERLIELLQEKRTALITRAVTKGLNPDVPMKDSAVEWLGEIPAHWEILPLKRCVLRRAGAIKTGPFGSQLLSSEMQGGDVKVYNQRTVIDRDFSGGENFISQEKFRELSAFAIYPGDVLVTTRGTIGRCAIVPKDAEQGILHPCLMRIQPDPDKLLREYLALLIQDSYLLRTQLGFASNATTIEVIYSNTMSCVLVPRPALSEQAAIVSWINERTAQIDGLIGKVSGGIDRLKEFRSALISAAVTGKIDVRREVAS